MEPSRDVTRSLALAKSIRGPWEARWQRLYELVLPYRTQFFDHQRPGGAPTATIYDDTGITACEEMASRLQTGIMPAGVEWASIEAADGASEDLRAGLAAVQKEMFRQIDRSNFGAELNDALKDLAGTGNCCIRLTGGDWSMPLRCMAIPLPNVLVTPGPDGLLGDLHIRYALPAYAVRAMWPGADLPESLLNTMDPQRVVVTDSWIRDLDEPVEHWHNEVHIESQHLLMADDLQGAGSCPYVFGRWSKAAGEVYASGQGMLALPTVETLYEVARLVLAHAEMGLSGMYQAEDDGVLNPWSIKLEPGMIVPIAPQSRGLMPISPPGSKVDLGLLDQKAMQMRVRKTMFNEQLGPRDGTTPPTAFEIQERMQDLLRQLGPAYHRVWNEMAVPILVRVRRILLDQGRIMMPLIDGRAVKVIAASSMVKAQAIGEVQRVKQALSDLGTYYGPAAVQTMTDGQAFAAYLGERYDVPHGIMLSAEQIAANAQRMGQLAGQAQAQGQDLTPLLAGMGVGAKAAPQ